MNLGQMEAALDRRFGVAFVQSAKDDLLNMALAQLSLEREWPWLEKTANLALVANQDTYALPSDWRRIRHVTVNGFEYPYISLLDIDTWDNGGEWVRNRGYAEWGGASIILRPVPGTADATNPIVVRYMGMEPILVAGTDTPLCPAQWHPAIIELACSLAFQRVEGPVGRRYTSRSQVYGNRYQDWLRRMEASLVSKVSGRRRVRTRP